MRGVSFAPSTPECVSASRNEPPEVALKEVNRAIVNHGGGPSAFSLPLRFSSGKEYARDDTLGDKELPRVSIPARRVQTGRGDVNWKAAASRQSLYSFHTATPRLATWSSWTSASMGNSGTGGVSWRRHFRTDSNGTVTTVTAASPSATDRSYFRVPPTLLPSSTATSEAEYQAFPHRNSNVQAWPQHQLMGPRTVPTITTRRQRHHDMASVPAADITAQQNQDTRSVPVATTTTLHRHQDTRSVPFAMAHHPKTMTSIPVGATTAQHHQNTRSVHIAMTTVHHHDPWHLHNRSSAARGYIHVEHHRSPNRLGTLQNYTATTTQYSKPWSPHPTVAAGSRNLSFAEATSSNPASHHHEPAQSKVKMIATNAPHVSKRLLLPPQQQQLFKKAKGFDKLDLLCTATLEIGELHDNPTGCSCPKSKCVALYCDCFKAGRRCHPTRCSCLDCKNTIAESGVDGARTKAIRCILARNPRAFTTAGMGNPTLKLPPGEVACNCVRSRCLKLYCSCFHNGKVCKPDVCTCVGCYNTEKDVEGHRQAAIQHAMEKRPDAFVVKPKEKGLGCACKNNRCIRKYCECFRTNLCCTDKCSCRECENREVSSPS